ncbi:MAG: hypothetical protein QM730_06960 [Anaerolineales bacterium]
MPSSATLQNLTSLAKENLANRLSIPTTEIRVVAAQAVTWSDASLGCPQEGYAYAQVLTPGYLILLEHGNLRYEYHAGKGSEVTYCPNPIPPIPADPGNT